jgi:hypothetical protein
MLSTLANSQERGDMTMIARRLLAPVALVLMTLPGSAVTLAPWFPA